jgi:hypothetical protein
MKNFSILSLNECPLFCGDIKTHIQMLSRKSFLPKAVLVLRGTDQSIMGRRLSDAMSSSVGYVVQAKRSPGITAQLVAHDIGFVFRGM